jgi:diguanylate cyclase (GGDEF)-like protein
MMMAGDTHLSDGEALVKVNEGEKLISANKPRRRSPRRHVLSSKSAGEIQEQTSELARLNVALLEEIEERKHSEEAEREERVLAEALSETAAVINSTLNFDEVLDHILSSVGRVIPHDSASIGLVNDLGEMDIVRARGYRERSLEENLLSLHLPLKDFPTLRTMAETGQPIIVSDVWADPEWVRVEKQDWIRSYAGMPILVMGHVVGFINLDSATPGFFTQAHLTRLQAFAHHVAVAIKNAHLFADVSRYAEQLATVNRIGLVVTSGLDMDHVLKAVHEQVQQVVPLDCFYIALYEDATGIIDWPLFYDMGEYTTGQLNIHTDPGMTGYIIQTAQTLYVPDLLDPNSKPPATVIRTGGNPTRSYVGVPMIIRNHVIGVISMQSYQARAYTQDQIRLLETISTQAAIAIENARLYSQMQQLAIIDSLTGIFNRRHFFALASKELQRAIRYKKDLSILMIDIDHFKQVNDTHGHRVGDQVLQAVAQLCSRALRKVDLIGRYGGEEFVVLLPETNLEKAKITAERMCQKIAEAEFPTSQGAMKTTASFGVTSMQPEGETLESLLDRSDKALYLAKQNGRNRVEAICPDNTI